MSAQSDPNVELYKTLATPKWVAENNGKHIIIAEGKVVCMENDAVTAMKKGQDAHPSSSKFYRQVGTEGVTLLS
jgi:hypothetical protein